MRARIYSLKNNEWDSVGGENNLKVKRQVVIKRAITTCDEPIKREQACRRIIGEHGG